MVAVSKYDTGDFIPVITADALCYNGCAVEFTSSVDSATGLPTVVIGTAADPDIAGVVDCGRVDGKAGTAADPYASGSLINIRVEGVVVMTDSGSGVTVAQYATGGAAGTVAGTDTYAGSTTFGRILNTAAAGGEVKVRLTIR